MRIIRLLFDIRILIRFLKILVWDISKDWFFNVRIQILNNSHSYRDTKFTYNLHIFYNIYHKINFEIFAINIFWIFAFPKSDLEKNVSIFVILNSPIICIFYIMHQKFNWRYSYTHRIRKNWFFNKRIPKTRVWKISIHIVILNTSIICVYFTLYVIKLILRYSQKIIFEYSYSHSQNQI